MRQELQNYSNHGRLTHKELLGILRKAGAYQFVDGICCDKVSLPELHIDKSKPCPKLIPLSCTHGHNGNATTKCTCCGVTNKLGILEALSNLE